VLLNTATDDPDSQSHLAAFQQALRQLGWSDGREVHFETRWGAGDPDTNRRYAVELVALAPDVILAAGGPVVRAIQAASRTVPIVFAQSIDPVGAGIVMSLGRPGRNATGLTQFDYSLSGKWPQLLKEIAPSVTRVGILRDASTPAGIGQWAVMQAMSPSFGIELTPIDVRDAGEIERDLTAFARQPNGGLVVSSGSLGRIHRKLLITLADRYRLPAVYHSRHFVAGGGLISYGPDLIDQYRQAASYVDRILKGEKPADMPVLAQAKYQLVVNLKTAKALDLTIPSSLLARADEVIE
jgi:putative ABC transport system substrate-binding protein